MLRRFPRSLFLLLSLAALVFIIVKYPPLVSLVTASATTGLRVHTLSIELEERRIIQEARLKAMHERCSELNDSWKEANWRSISVNLEKRLVMCLVGKAAGTTWKRVLLRLTGNPQAVQLAEANRHVLHRDDAAFLGRFHVMNWSMRNHYLKGHYYRVLFVREPLERLISGYRDKMFRAYDYVGMRTQIKRMFRPHVSVRSPEFAKNVTFDEFIRYVLWETEHRTKVDAHWRPQYDICRPCHIQYDYIGYYETMRDDAKDVLRKISAGPDVQFPLGDYDSRVLNSNKYLELFQDVDAGDIRRILDFYKNDYKVSAIKYQMQ